MRSRKLHPLLEHYLVQCLEIIAYVRTFSMIHMRDDTIPDIYVILSFCESYSSEHTQYIVVMTINEAD